VETFERNLPLARRVMVLTERRQVPLIERLLPGLDAESLIVEPAARGTTNALGLAALTLLERDPDAIMVSAAADHVIDGAAAYGEAIEMAVRVAAESRQMVAVGLRPTHPATGLGYIEAGPEERFGPISARRVLRFVEKPDVERARAYVESGRFYWNLAMFCFRCDVFVEELGRHGPNHLAGLRDVLAARAAGDEEEAASAYGRLPVEAIDYTVMERTDRLLLVPAGFRWADVGSWSELADLLPKDRHGNVVEGGPVLIDTTGSYVWSAPGKLVAVIGLDGVVVVDTPDALLVCSRSRAQDVKKVVAELSRRERTDYL
jgi:mannose-1-phosphate guanylyltransferase